MAIWRELESKRTDCSVLMDFADGDLEVEIVRLHTKEQLAPSEIDKKLGLPKDTAHDVMCRVWKNQKENRRKS